jgi:hypothetical protein
MTTRLAEQLGNDVIDALTAAGHPVRDQFGDGYQVHAPSLGAPEHVVIEDVREGVLYGVGDWRRMNAQRLQPYAGALEATGFVTELLLETDPRRGPLALVVARDADALREGLAMCQAAVKGGA